MLIKKIQELNKSRVRVILEDDFSFVLYKGEVRSYKVVEGEDLPDEVFEVLMTTVLPKRAKLRAMNLLKSRPYTVKGLTDKLKDGGYPESVINIAIDYVSSYNYLNDKQYALDYIYTYKNSKNKARIFLDLTNKGISKDIISSAYEEEVGDDTKLLEEEQIKSFLRKKGYSSDKVPYSQIGYEEKMKLLASLYRKGFSTDLSKKILSVDD